MRQQAKLNIFAGIMIWIVVIVLLVTTFKHLNSNSPRAVESLISYLGSQRCSLSVVSPDHVVLGIGDPVFMHRNGVFQPVAMVTGLTLDQSQRAQQRDGAKIRLAWVKQATITFFSGAPLLGKGATVELNQTDQSPAWIVKTMLSPSMRDSISQLIRDAYQEHQAELIEQFRPVIEQTLFKSAQIIRDGVADELQRRQNTVSAISQRYQNDVLPRELMPVIEADVWPIVAEEARPLVKEIGHQIWQEVSVWRFGWRLLYDKSPLPDKKLSQKEFDRFVKNKALPIFEAHFADVIEMQKRMTARILANKKVTERGYAVARQFFSDEEVQTLLKDVLYEVVVDNRDLQKSIAKIWQSDKAKRAMELANGRLESTVIQIGRALFGAPRGNITTEFARVLRNRVLHKDNRWLVLQPGTVAGLPNRADSTSALPLTMATQENAFPMTVFAGQSQSPLRETISADE